MADRTSAYIFGEIFRDIASMPALPIRSRLAKEYWKMSREYDFSEYQMEADEALLKLGLARKGVDPDYPEDGDVMLYGPKP